MSRWIAIAPSRAGRTKLSIARTDTARPTPLDQALDLLERQYRAGCDHRRNRTLHEPGAVGEAISRHLAPRQALSYGRLCVPSPGRFPPWGHDMDYNIQVDVVSALMVIQRSSPTLVPLSVTVETSLRRAYLTTLRQSGPLLSSSPGKQRPCQGREQRSTLRSNVHRFARRHHQFPTRSAGLRHRLGWNEGVEISEIPLKAEIEDGWLYQRIDDSGTPTRVVTGVKRKSV